MAIAISIDSPDLQSAMVTKRLLDAIKIAEVASDCYLLERIESHLKSRSEIPEAHKAALSNRIKSAVATIPARQEGSVDPIQKLIESSRGGIFDDDSWLGHPGKWLQGPIIERPPESVSTIPVMPDQGKPFSLVNATNWTIAYRIDQGGWEQLPPYMAVGGSNLRGFHKITFDAGRGIVRSYSVGGNPVERFQLRGDGTVDLYH